MAIKGQERFPKCGLPQVIPPVVRKGYNQFTRVKVLKILVEHCTINDVRYMLKECIRTLFSVRKVKLFF